MRVFAAIAAAILVVAAGAEAAGPPAASPVPVAALTVTDRSGPARPLAALLDGRAVVHLWATWCAPCREELPDLAAFLAAHPDLAGRIVVLSVDTAPVTRVAMFLDELGAALPPLKLASGNAGAAFGVRGYPATVFLDGDGSVVRVHPGPLRWSDAAAGIAAHLTAR